MFTCYCKTTHHTHTPSYKLLNNYMVTPPTSSMQREGQFQTQFAPGTFPHKLIYMDMANKRKLWLKNEVKKLNLKVLLKINNRNQVFQS